MKEIIAYDDWNQRIRKHETEIGGLLDGWYEKRKQKEKHPVIDFLFQYFSFPYNRLKTWTPGLGKALEGPANKNLSIHRFEEKKGLLFLKEELLPNHRTKALKWTISLLKKTMSNPTCFNCYGLHEWAMVYKAGTVRHDYTALRLSNNDINRIVEEKELNCTHYDALRFYTESARPLNKYTPTRETQENFEQSACLHANMDLYKWAYKIYPFIESELLLECFKLALDCRTVDMKASPYDLEELGYTPIKIETPEGKEEYVKEQLRLKLAAEPIRKELLNNYLNLLNVIEQ